MKKSYLIRTNRFYTCAKLYYNYHNILEFSNKILSPEIIIKMKSTSGKKSE